MSVPFTLLASCFTVAWVVIFEVTHCLSACVSEYFHVMCVSSCDRVGIF